MQQLQATEVAKDVQIDTPCNQISTEVNNKHDVPGQKVNSIGWTLIRDEGKDSKHLAEIENQFSSKYTRLDIRNSCPSGLTWYLSVDNATRSLELQDIEKDTAMKNDEMTIFLKLQKVLELETNN